MAGEDRAYLKWVRGQPCCRCGVNGPSEAHHRTGAGMGLRSHDHTAIPLCLVCHKNLHEFQGDFKGHSRGDREEWQKNKAKEMWVRSAWVARK